VNQDFINTDETIAWDDIDFYDGHGEIECYSFWALIMDNSEWLKVVSEVAIYLGHYVHKEYRLQPHVVTEVEFCSYQTNDIQGRITVFI
jgi:hypothetical protein